MMRTAEHLSDTTMGYVPCVPLAYPPLLSEARHDITQ